MAIAAIAQPKADIEVSYTAHRPNPRNGKDDVTDQYILLTNTTDSKFYSPLTEYIDSLNSSPEGKAKLNEMTRAAFTSGNLDDIPTVDGSFYVVKSLEEGKLKHYDHGRLEEKFVYEGFMSIPRTDSTVRPMPVSAKISAGIQSDILFLIRPSSSLLTEFFSRESSKIRSFNGVSIGDAHTFSIFTAVRFTVKRMPQRAIIAKISFARRNSTSLTLLTQSRGSPFLVMGR